MSAMLKLVGERVDAEARLTATVVLDIIRKHSIGLKALAVVAAYVLKEALDALSPDEREPLRRVIAEWL